MFNARISVRPRKELVDPESETIKKSLIDLNFQIETAKTYRIYEILLNAESKKEAESIAKTMCSRLLVNPVKDNYSIEVEQAENAAAKP
ncbi:MAG TPA: phosphoribosylformylglycinamidine synthase subunit PurS [Nitrososphaerales archaeon]|nr:phosphoribosylformylglycinamidine synthase subunit PurS [Nitrososphaerales archaeon]